MDTSSPTEKPWQNEFFLKYAIASAWISAILAIYLILYATTLWEDWDWWSKTLSNLGNPNKGITSPILNGAYIIGGMGAFPFFFYFARETFRHDGNFAKLGSIFLILSAVAICTMGILTDFDATLDAHRGASLTFFIGFGFFLLFTSISWIRQPPMRKYVLINMILLAIGAGVWILDGSDSAPWTNQAIPEFISVLCFMSLIAIYTVKAWFSGLSQQKN